MKKLFIAAMLIMGGLSLSTVSSANAMPIAAASGIEIAGDNVQLVGGDWGHSKHWGHKRHWGHKGYWGWKKHYYKKHYGYKPYYYGHKRRYGYGYGYKKHYGKFHKGY